MSPVRTCALACALLAACEDADLHGVGSSDAGAPAGSQDVGLRADGGAGDTGTARADAGVVPRDAGEEVDAGGFSCDPLAARGDPAEPAPITGRIALWDFHTWDDARGESTFWRNFQVVFTSTAYRVGGGGFDAVLYRGIPAEGCVAFDRPAAQSDLRPFRNAGRSITVTNESGTMVVLTRSIDPTDGTRYDWPSGPALARFGDPRQTPLDQRWAWSSNGDPPVRIQPARAEIPPVEDFEVTPAYTSTSAALVIDPAGFTLRWTPPARRAGTMSIALSRALSPMGDGRYLICRPEDDGEYTIAAADIAAFGPVQGLPFGLDVARSEAVPFCNEGAPAGVVTHTVVHLGSAIVP